MRFLVLCFLVVVLIHCQNASDPYQGRATVSPYSTPTPAPTGSPTPIPRWSLDVPDIMLFKEDLEGRFSIRGFVEPPGQPVFSFVNKPAGMIHDTTTNEVVWTPSLQEVPTKGEKKILTMQVQMGSTSEPKSAVTKNVVVIVEDSETRVLQ